MINGMFKLENGSMTLSISTLVESWKPSRPQETGIVIVTVCKW